jgi:hypothetical protein
MTICSSTPALSTSPDFCPRSKDTAKETHTLCLFVPISFTTLITSIPAYYTPCHHHDGHDVHYTHLHQDSISGSKQQMWHQCPCLSMSQFWIPMTSYATPTQSWFWPLDPNATSITSKGHIPIYTCYPGQWVRSQQQTVTWISPSGPWRNIEKRAEETWATCLCLSHCHALPYISWHGFNKTCRLNHICVCGSKIPTRFSKLLYYFSHFACHTVTPLLKLVKLGNNTVVVLKFPTCNYTATYHHGVTGFHSLASSLLVSQDQKHWRHIFKC